MRLNPEINLFNETYAKVVKPENQDGFVYKDPVTSVYGACATTGAGVYDAGPAPPSGYSAPDYFSFTTTAPTDSRGDWYGGNHNPTGEYDPTFSSSAKPEPTYTGLTSYEWNTSSLFPPDPMYGAPDSLQPQVSNVSYQGCHQPGTSSLPVQILPPPPPPPLLGVQQPLELDDALNVMKTHADISKNIEYKNGLEAVSPGGGLAQ